MLILEIVIPEYPLYVEVSKKQNIKYYKKGGKFRVPSVHQPAKYDSLGYAIDVNGERIIRNPISAGKPRLLKLNGNKFLEGYGNHNLRNKIKERIKEAYRPYLLSVSTILKDFFPLRVTWEVHAVPSHFDISNFWFYYKYFEDCLTEERVTEDGDILPKIIPDDTVRYITQSPGPLLIPTKRDEERKFIFRFFDDKRSIIKNHMFWEYGNNL